MIANDYTLVDLTDLPHWLQSELVQVLIVEGGGVSCVGFLLSQALAGSQARRRHILMHQSWHLNHRIYSMAMLGFIHHARGAFTVSLGPELQLRSTLIE